MTFVDTSFWAALTARADAHHEVAAALWHSRPRALVTSNHVVGETWTFLNRRHGHSVAVDFTAGLRASPSLAVVHIAAEVEDEAWRWLHRHDERAYSFVDATSFAYMRRHKIGTAFAFDGDFAAVGFTEARP
ncbi:MAG TPA: PIN domain-containing protein [Jiangellaceae bacterium]|nr:PIN domain-containing protein [Jiangellaceae bacterium]